MKYIYFLFFFVLLPRILLSQDISSDIDRLQKNMSDLANDLKFGLTEYLAETDGEFESSPDSIHWFKAKAKMVDLRCEEWQWLNAKWTVDTIQNDRPIDNTAQFRFETCEREEIRSGGKVQYKVADFWVPKQGVDFGSCVAVGAISWPILTGAAFSRTGSFEGDVQYVFEDMRCIDAKMAVNGITESIWVGSTTTKEGNHLVYKVIAFKENLPVRIEVCSYQAGFKGIKDLPPRNRCIVPRIVTVEWTNVDGISVPKKVNIEFVSFGGGEDYERLVFSCQQKFYLKDSSQFKKKYEEVSKIVEEIPRRRPVQVNGQVTRKNQ